MFLLSFLLVGLAYGYLRGGSLRGLAVIPIRHSWLILVGPLLQVVAFSGLFAILPQGALLARDLYVFSYYPILLCLLANLSLRPLWLALAGTAANVTAIVANGGYMPASAEALRTAGMLYELDVISWRGHYGNSVLLGPQTQLVPLCDVLPFPGGTLLATVFSIGDIAIGLGAMWLVIQAMLLHPRRIPTANLGPGKPPA